VGGRRRPAQALAESQPLGWLVSFIVKPDPTRLAPSPPFDAESAKLRGLIDELEDRLNPELTHQRRVPRLDHLVDQGRAARRSR
jgi:hypothetical protein